MTAESDWGRFPFGRPNARRPMRHPDDGRADALIVGVYPSAFHVAWSPPSAIDARSTGVRRRPYISSLAVDVEPTVFWDGVAPSPEALLADWIASSEFDPDNHGTIRPGTNGPSGAGLIKDFLSPLKVDPARCAFTDVVPWFFVKYDAKGQGAAIRDRFAPLAAVLGVHAGSLPPRPSRRDLVAIASGPQRRDSLREELLEAGADLVITLGQEALDAVASVAEVNQAQIRLAPAGYGRRGRVTAAGRTLQLLPLVHPGFVRQTSNEAWSDDLATWRSSPA